MATNYADRGFLSINGVEVLELESVTWKFTDGTKAVPTMTRDRRTKGFVKGNREITLSCSIAVQELLNSPAIELIDYVSQDVAATVEMGGDRLTFIGLDFVDVDESASGVGSEVKKSYNLVARDIINQKIDSPLFNTALSLIP